MSHDQLMNLIDSIASDFLFLEDQDVDIPTAGKFLNQLDAIIRGAEALKIEPLSCVARGLSRLLEKKILDEVKDTETAFATFEKGITIMQEIDRSFSKGGDNQSDIGSFMESVSRLTGVAIAIELEGTVEKSTEPNNESNEASEKKIEIQDESLLRDFIVEGLEYINEIEVNILNLEQDPGNKDCVNSIFRPFHSIKGVASFLNLGEIR